MIHTIHRLKEFLKYQQSAKTKYYLHSPFVYQLYLNILEGIHSTEIQNINNLRKKLTQTYDKILIEDMGAAPGTIERTVAYMAAKASVPERYGAVLHRLVKYLQPGHIIELGTCLGLGTAYMASGHPKASVTTIEGSAALAHLAQANLDRLNIRNVQIVRGSFEVRLQEVLQTISRLDMAYIDGNHRYAPTMRYFHLLMAKSHEQTVLIFDDIYWSPEMTRAWQEIKADPRITLTIDIHRFGIVFMDRGKMAKEDFVLRY